MAAETRYRLADTTVAEPLVDGWSAWAQLISPVPAALHLLNFQTFALSSYLEDPEAHVAASRDPDLIGGPFVDVPPERAGEVRGLLDDMRARRGAALELARSFTDFHNWLVGEAQGQSLEPYYAAVPEALRGYVELVYDYYNRPIVRLHENLLYHGDHYDETLQSLKLWRLERDLTRPFFMSTPRLAGEGQFDWRRPFADSSLDELFRTDVEPQPLGRIREALGLGASEEALLLPLLTTEPAAPPPPWEGDEVRVRYFGHACLLIEWRGVSILTDPFVGAAPAAGGVERFSYRDLPARIDFALVTHNHQDHFALETLLRLRHRIGQLVVPRNQGLLYGDMSLRLLTKRVGFPRVVELEALEAIGFPGGEIVAVPFLGEHGDLAHSKSAYVVRAGRQQMLVAADSDCLDRELYANVRRTLGPVETVFLGTESVGAPLSWGCGPLFPRKMQRAHEQGRRYHGSDAARGLELLETVAARRVYNYAMGLEPWVEHLLGLGLTEDAPQFIESEKLLARAAERGFLAAERLWGKTEFFLEEPDAVAALPGVERAAPPAALEADDARDADDQFVF
ncbi:MAG TPA: MBL fold metallo-hydrolase [Pyrinomonadaceae bacterium]|nr:MBL fold metallo-hydrolase [Pyrinomonadaceae bacterium]